MMNAPSDIPAGIIKTIELYIEAGRQSRVELSRQAFDKDATMAWVENGVCHIVSIEEFFKTYEGWQPAKVSYEIRAFDMDDNIAMISLNSQFAGTRYTDMFTIIRNGEVWKIAGKIYRKK